MTQAMARAAVVAFVLLAVAALYGRAEALLLGGPFMAYLLLALVRRPSARPPSRVEPGDRVTLPAQVAVRVAGQDTRLVSVAWDLAPGLLGRRGSAQVADLASSGGVIGEFEARAWGDRTLGRATVVQSDLTGAWRTEEVVPGPVLAKGVASGKLPGNTSLPLPIGVVGAHLSPRRGPSATKDEIRPYLAGDQRRLINWRVTGRRGQVHVNTTLAERDTDILVLADTRFEVPGDADETSLDVTCEAVATISRHYAGQGDRVGLHDLGGRVATVPFGGGRRQAALITHALAAVDRGGPSRTSALRLRIRPGTTVFLCTPLLSPRADRELGRLIGQAWRLIVVDTLPSAFGSLAGPASGRELAFAVRRLQRDALVEQVRRTGTPVVPWAAASGLGSLLGQLEHQRGAARLGARR